MSTQSLTIKIKEAAQMLGVSTKWCYLNKHLIPGYFTIGKSIFINREIFIESLKTRATKTVKSR